MDKLIEQVKLLLEDSEQSLSYIENFEKDSNDCLKNAAYNKGSIDACNKILKVIALLANVKPVINPPN